MLPVGPGVDGPPEPGPPAVPLCCEPPAVGICSVYWS